MKTNIELARECAEHIRRNNEMTRGGYDTPHTTESIILAALTAASERDKVKQSELAMALGMFDLAYHRLKNQATRLLLTRRKLPSDYQDAVLASYLDDLSRIVSEPDPQWPRPMNSAIDAARAKEKTT